MKPYLQYGYLFHGCGHFILDVDPKWTLIAGTVLLQARMLCSTSSTIVHLFYLSLLNNSLVGEPPGLCLILLVLLFHIPWKKYHSYGKPTRNVSCFRRPWVSILCASIFSGQLPFSAGSHPKTVGQNPPFYPPFVWTQRGNLRQIS